MSKEIFTHCVVPLFDQVSDKISHFHCGFCLCVLSQKFKAKWDNCELQVDSASHFCLLLPQPIFQDDSIEIKCKNGSILVVRSFCFYLINQGNGNVAIFRNYSYPVCFLTSLSCKWPTSIFLDLT